MDRRIIKTKRAIRNAFSDLIKEKDIDKITITELTERADIDRRTFYFHYNTIMDIVMEIEKEVIQSLNEKFCEKVNGFEIHDFFSALNSIVFENYDVIKCVTHTTNYRLHKECSNTLYSTLHKVFYERSGLDSNTFDYYCTYVTAGIMAVYIKWLSTSQNTDLDELCILATNAVKDGWLSITGQNQ